MADTFKSVSALSQLLYKYPSLMDSVSKIPVYGSVLNSISTIAKATNDYQSVVNSVTNKKPPTGATFSGSSYKYVSSNTYTRGTYTTGGGVDPKTNRPYWDFNGARYYHGGEYAMAVKAWEDAEALRWNAYLYDEERNAKAVEDYNTQLGTSGIFNDLAAITNSAAPTKGTNAGIPRGLIDYLSATGGGAVSPWGYAMKNWTNTFLQAGRAFGGVAQGVTKALGAVPMLLESAANKLTDKFYANSQANLYKSDTSLSVDKIKQRAKEERQDTTDVSKFFGGVNSAIENWTNSWVPAAQSGEAQFVAKAADAFGEAIPGAAASWLTGGGALFTNALGAGVGASNAFSTEMLEGSGELGQSLISGLTEYATERLSSKLLGPTVDKISNKAVSWLANSGTEGIEEVVSGGVQSALTGQGYSLGQAAEDFALGSVVGGILGGANIAANSSSSQSNMQTNKVTTAETTTSQPSQTIGAMRGSGVQAPNGLDASGLQSYLDETMPVEPSNLNAKGLTDEISKINVDVSTADIGNNTVETTENRRTPPSNPGSDNFVGVDFGGPDGPNLAGPVTDDTSDFSPAPIDNNPNISIGSDGLKINVQDIGDAATQTESDAKTKTATLVEDEEATDELSSEPLTKEQIAQMEGLDTALPAELQDAERAAGEVSEEADTVSEADAAEAQVEPQTETQTQVDAQREASVQSETETQAQLNQQPQPQPQPQMQPETQPETQTETQTAVQIAPEVKISTETSSSVKRPGVPSMVANPDPATSTSSKPDPMLIWAPTQTQERQIVSQNRIDRRKEPPKPGQGVVYRGDGSRGEIYESLGYKATFAGLSSY